MPLRRMTFSSTKAGAGRTLRAALQLRHIANREIEMPPEDGLTHVRLLAQRSYDLARNRLNLGQLALAKMAEG
jgi:hypothetical protein